MRPPSSFSRPLMQRISVDLPEPEEPRIDTTSPGWTVRLTPSRTTALPNAFLTSTASIMSESPERAVGAQGVVEARADRRDQLGGEVIEDADGRPDDERLQRPHVEVGADLGEVHD